MILKKEKYKEVEITYEVNEEGRFSAYALDILSANNKNGLGYQFLDQASIEIKIEIEKILLITPKNIGELAKQITSTLIWTGYEECHVDEFILKTLLDNYLKYLNK